MLCIWWLFIISVVLFKTEAKIDFEKWNLPQKQHEPTIEEAIVNYFAKRTNHLHIGINLLEQNHLVPGIKQDLSNALQSSSNLTITIYSVLISETWNPSSRPENLLYVDSFIAFKQIVSHTNLRGSYVVILTNIKLVNVHVERILATAFDLSIINIVVVVTRKANKSATIYGYEIFSDNKCKSLQPIVINRFVNGSFSNAELFPNKLRNFHNCTLQIGIRELAPYFTLGNHTNVTLLDTKGIESEFLKVIAQKLNFQVKFSINSLAWGAVEENGTTTGAFTGLRAGKFDVLIGGFTWTPYRPQYFSYSKTYLFCPLVCVIRNQDFNNHYWMVDPFNWPVWILIILVLLTSLLRAKLNAVLSRNHQKIAPTGCRLSWLDLIGIAFNTPISFKSSPRSYTRMIILFGFIIIHTIYVGKLYAAYNLQVVAAGTKYGWKKYQRPKILALSGPAVIESVLNSTENVAAIVPLDVALEHMHEYQLHSVLQILPPPVLTLQICAFFEKNSFLDKPFNEVIRNLQAGGFFEFWVRAQQYKFKVQEQKRISLARYPKPLTLDTYHLVFLTFIMLNMIACFVFLGELLIHRFKGRRD